MNWSRLTCGAGALLVALSVMAPAGAKSLPVGRLATGDSVFWNGPQHIDSRPQSSGGLGGSYVCHETIECFEYTLDVAGPGSLRVAIDTNDGDDYYYVRVFNPQDDQVAAFSPLYSAERTVRASIGTWLIVVEARRVTDGSFRMRALLEEPKSASSASVAGPRRALLPNLRLLPPFKFTFDSAAFTPLGSNSGCAEDETVEHLPTRCLRFSLGPANFGDGPLELRYQQLEGVVAPGKIYQRIHYSDGTTEEREAGTFEYHTTHGHFHHAGFGSLELWRVVDANQGVMERAGEGPKQGFCMAPYVIVAWKTFANDPAGSAEANCFEMTPATGSHMGLDRGWADIYEWYLSGNYVDFGPNPDGLYVVRSMTDAGRDILETNEKDNWGYAYIRISGDDITVLERGYGKSPWDPKKMVEPDWLRLTV